MHYLWLILQATNVVPNSEIDATHTTPVKKYVDDLTFKFSASGSTACTVNVSLNDITYKNH